VEKSRIAPNFISKKGSLANTAHAASAKIATTQAEHKGTEARNGKNTLVPSTERSYVSSAVSTCGASPGQSDANRARKRKLLSY
jgi:hypothetical protein